MKFLILLLFSYQTFAYSAHDFFSLKNASFGTRDSLLFFQPKQVRPTIEISLPEDIHKFCTDPGWRANSYPALFKQIDESIDGGILAELKNELQDGLTRLEGPKANVKNIVESQIQSKLDAKHWERALNENVNSHWLSFASGDEIRVSSSMICSMYRGELKVYSLFSYFENPKSLASFKGYLSERVGGVTPWDAGQEIAKVLKNNPLFDKNMDYDLIMKIYESKLSKESIDYKFNRKNNFFRKLKNKRSEYEVSFNITN